MNVLSNIDYSKVISVFCDRSRPETHLSGYMGGLSDDEMILKHISKDGFYDGFILIHLSDIFRIDFDGKYEQKLQTLYEYRKQIHPIIGEHESLYLSLLCFCKAQNLIVSIELEESQLAGFLIHFDYDSVRLLVIDDYGMPNGETVVDSNEILSIAVDTSSEQNMRILYHEREK